MADKVDGDLEVFEITDFTTASDWERFIAKLEEVLHQWKLDGSTRKSPFSKVLSFPIHSESVRKLNPIPSKKSDEDKDGVWAVMREQLAFGNFSFSVAYHYLRSRRKERNQANQSEDFEDGLPEAVMDMFDMTFDFPPRAHCLSRWYGLKEFLVIVPTQHLEAIDNESRCSLLLSSIAVAFNNSKCSIPTFIQTHQRWRRLHSGVCVGGGFRTSFGMSQLHHVPANFGHLAGMLEIFKSKLNCPISPVPSAMITVRFTYTLDEWTEYAWPQEPPDPTSCLECQVGIKDLHTLPFGACQDPISQLHVSTTWPCLTEEVVVDNAVYSDLDPVQAPQWSVRVRMSDNPQCLLGEYLHDYVKLCHQQGSTLQILQRKSLDDEESTADITHALQKLTEPAHSPVSSLSSAVNRATYRLSAMSDQSPQECPIAVELLTEILKHLFPDAMCDPQNIETQQQELVQQENEAENSSRQERFRGLKTAPEGELTYLLGICICLVYHSYGGLKAVAHLWQEFVLEMRFRWDNDVFIPRLKIQAPNLGCCLIHQKLQMLNCCIERRKASKMRSTSNTVIDPKGRAVSKRDSKERLSKERLSPSKRVNSESDRSISSNDDDDEFYEALENQEESEESENALKDSTQETNREGVLDRCGDMTLRATDQPLCIPVTQEPAPMTEDMLHEHAEVLTQLGTSQEGSRVRAQMQCASLLSDMEAFKAANPRCLLEDFVRWYSPNDWIPGPETEEELEELAKFRTQKGGEGEISETRDTIANSTEEGWELGDDDVTEQLQEGSRVEGHLSLRMRTPGNVWEEVWHNARAVPVRRQKRLFDETKEAEKVLHYLACLTPAQVAFQLAPVLLHAAIIRVEQSGGADIPAVTSLLDQVLGKASKLQWELPKDLPQFEEFIKQVQLAEMVISRAESLKFKFRDALAAQEKKLQQVGGEKDIADFLSALMEKPEVPVIGAGRGPAGRVIHRLFAKQESMRLEQEKQEQAKNGKYEPESPSREFPSPSGREYILRTTIPRPSPASRPCPQRLYCVMTDDEFRLAGAFTDDVVFQ